MLTYATWGSITHKLEYTEQNPMVKFATCAVGALLYGASVMLSADAFAGTNRRSDATSLKMVSIAHGPP